MSGGTVKGWCPGAHRPMLSGDGLLVRVRPRHGRLTAEAALGLLRLAQRHGNGTIDLTSRANLQIRGVAEDAHEALLDGLFDLGLLDETPELESRRNVLVTPFWTAGDATHSLAARLDDLLGELPDLPAKVGFAVDTGPHPLLRDASADIRLERAPDGGLILRAEGAARGRAVTEADAGTALLDMAHWLADRITPDRRRMASVLAEHDLPADWRSADQIPTGRRRRRCQSYGQCCTACKRRDQGLSFALPAKIGRGSG